MKCEDDGWRLQPAWASRSAEREREGKGDPSIRRSFIETSGIIFRLSIYHSCFTPVTLNRPSFLAGNIECSIKNLPLSRRLFAIVSHSGGFEGLPKIAISHPANPSPMRNRFRTPPPPMNSDKSTRHYTTRIQPRYSKGFLPRDIFHTLRLNNTRRNDGGGDERIRFKGFVEKEGDFPKVRYKWRKFSRTPHN